MAKDIEVVQDEKINLSTQLNERMVQHEKELKEIREHIERVAEEKSQELLEIKNRLVEVEAVLQANHMIIITVEACTILKAGLFKGLLQTNESFSTWERNWILQRYNNGFPSLPYYTTQSRSKAPLLYKAQQSSPRNSSPTKQQISLLEEKFSTLCFSATGRFVKDLITQLSEKRKKIAPERNQYERNQYAHTTPSSSELQKLLYGLVSRQRDQPPSEVKERIYNYAVSHP